MLKFLSSLSDSKRVKENSEKTKNLGRPTTPNEDKNMHEMGIFIVKTVD